VGGEARPPGAFSPVLEAFVGEGGSPDWPKGVMAPDNQRRGAGEAMAGCEVMGGLHFRTTTLDPGESRTCVLILAIIDAHARPQTLVQRYGDQRQFKPALPGWLFDEHGTVTSTFLGQTEVTYHNPDRADVTPQGKPATSHVVRHTSDDQEIELGESIIGAPYAEMVRAGLVSSIDVYFLRAEVPDTRITTRE
jgi:hypothetical protein